MCDQVPPFAPRRLQSAVVVASINTSYSKHIFFITPEPNYIGRPPESSFSTTDEKWGFTYQWVEVSHQTGKAMCLLDPCSDITLGESKEPALVWAPRWTFAGGAGEDSICP